ncbi:EVE domain-containing protein [Flaviflagellibacter deserti]|uniref:EVE domain-containing protein n=1 Tax=Flaviflagellibacter deserti TaxID=2267266 RepID=A0ABV9YWE8_9HYPH
MDEQVARTLSRITSFEDLAQFETNVHRRGAMTDEIATAITARSAFLGFSLIGARTGLDLSSLTPAETRIVEAVSEYVGVMKRHGKDATRTLGQLRNRGLIGSAEEAVARANPTQGFRILQEENRQDLSYEQIILDHPEEFSERAAWYARRTLGLPNDSERPPAKNGNSRPSTVSAKSNPDWTREEHILALSLYMTLRGSTYAPEHPGIIELSDRLKALARLRGVSGASTFRNPNGVSMKMMNFRRIDPSYTTDGRVGLERGSKTEEAVWQDFANDPAALGTASEAILAEIEAGTGNGVSVECDVPYWVFVCNPAKWAIDRFLSDGIDVDSWGVRPSDQYKFKPGQLGIVRVGVDRRSVAKRGGASPLEPGIYALCEVESEAFPGTGASDAYWTEGAEREPGWPTVPIRYLRKYLTGPLSIERLRRERPGLSHLLLNGHQAASFPIPADDFQAVLALLNEDAEELPSPTTPPVDTPDKLAELEQRYMNASPEVKTRVSKGIERGPIGAAVKRANGYRCQLCEGLGLNSIGFKKRNGEPYVEAHHVMPVSKRQIGSLSATNVVTLCANHHREVHYGDVSVTINAEDFEFSIQGTIVRVPRPTIGREKASSEAVTSEIAHEVRAPASS